ncbi:ASCH domain-containing protein [Pseudoalteromonas sp. HF66]|uniref:ASCH domain-containing protein n=1 Tax=Pseudoalteromonas sp. HF66 TaxID=2721559 RepID=UPI001430ED37|nr:ASCH domain-containing protein [Pseudoalteromonas sp. HF66]NIZ05268.1 ASCH domain-containing protein [Pseudoalteromonas sp. HF66]
MQQLSNERRKAHLIARFNEQSGRAIIELPSWHFCDNEQDANDCALLVLSGEKQATTPSLYWFEANNEALPEVGDLAIFTNWHGQPLGIIETVSVTIIPYNQISADYAALEGEGDKSLAYWQRVHWDYYQRELAGTNYQCHPDMPLVCEQFKLVFKESE